MSEPTTNPWEAQRAAMGLFIRSQRELANMSLRQLSQATQVSNAYLSQIERGQNDPTLRILVQIGNALQLSVEDMLSKGASWGAGSATPLGLTAVELAVRADPYLASPEKEALLGVYRSYIHLAAGRAGEDDPTGAAEQPANDSEGVTP